MGKRALIAGTCLALSLTGCDGGSDADAEDPAVGNTGETSSDATDPSGTNADGPVEGGASPPFDSGAEDDPSDPGAPVPPVDSGPNDARPTGDGDIADVAPLVGLWDYSRDTADGRDSALFDIAADGTITEYDDQADETGSGMACYEVRTALLAARGEGRYDIQNTSTLPGSESIDDVLITVEGDTITFRYIGAAFDPEFGEGMNGITESYPRASGIAVGELTACSAG